MQMRLSTVVSGMVPSGVVRRTQGTILCDRLSRRHHHLPWRGFYGSLSSGSLPYNLAPEKGTSRRLKDHGRESANFSSFLPVESLYISHSVFLSIATARIKWSSSLGSANTYFPRSLQPRSINTLCCYKPLGALMPLVSSIKPLITYIHSPSFQYSSPNILIRPRLINIILNPVSWKPNL